MGESARRARGCTLDSHGGCNVIARSRDSRGSDSHVALGVARSPLHAAPSSIYLLRLMLRSHMRSTVSAVRCGFLSRTFVLVEIRCVKLKKKKRQDAKLVESCTLLERSSVNLITLREIAVFASDILMCATC